MQTYANWDAAYGWGDHSQAGYLTSETDPVFAASDAAAVTAAKISNWDNAYSWVIIVYRDMQHKPLSTLH